MRIVQNFNDAWEFFKENLTLQQLSDRHGQAVTLPHTWNATDGQDGGDDYYRGSCWYVKRFSAPPLSPESEVWLEFTGAAMTAEVYLNGTMLACHKGGFSTFRVDLTASLQQDNFLAVCVNNGKNRTVYPQKADFTFYGGLYRDVNLLIVPNIHFALDRWGSSGIQITPVVDLATKTADVTAEAWVSGAAQMVTFKIDGHSKTVPVTSGHACAIFHLSSVHLWDGRNDPYLYQATAELESGDAVSTNFGCRQFTMDPEKGFLLNGSSYRLCGAARHQDRQGIGNALTPCEHEEDMALLLEMGANTVRLAHYQHDQYFYDLCDRYGIIVWAEIPYITEHLPEASSNALTQMRELILQNYNHPSIVCWGLSNEITATGGVSEDLKRTHQALNDLCHQLDPSRPTTMAHAFMLEPDNPFVTLSDICSYNLYYGWYLGSLEENERFLDNFHANHPAAVIGLTEYGADSNPSYQSATPVQGDWSEGYQALYHEHMLKMWSERPYIWAMHCWNMFDFGADGRNEGGKPGQNQKGLVTFDRKIKKDAFYLYKAYLSNEPFVHLCGTRYAERVENETEIKVYSNQPEITLFINGCAFATQRADKIFRFRIPLTGTQQVEARSGALSDTMELKKTTQINPSYCKNPDAIVNWFEQRDNVKRDGYYSIKDSMADIKQCPAAAALLEPLAAKASSAYGEVAQGIQIPPAMQKIIDQMSVENTLRQMGKLITPQDIADLNRALNRIPKK